MTVNAIKIGDPKLWTASSPVVKFGTTELTQLIEKMRDTMTTFNGVGLAAPQIGYNDRVIIFGFDENPRYPNEKPVPFTVLINPSFEPISEEKNSGWEGCLSIPGLRGKVDRYTEIKYFGYDLTGKQIKGTASHFHARVIQHECDHLDGILFLQRLIDLKQLYHEDVDKNIIQL